MSSIKGIVITLICATLLAIAYWTLPNVSVGRSQFHMSSSASPVILQDTILLDLAYKRADACVELRYNSLPGDVVQFGDTIATVYKLSHCEAHYALRKAETVKDIDLKLLSEFPRIKGYIEDIAVTEDFPGATEEVIPTPQRAGLNQEQQELISAELMGLEDAATALLVKLSQGKLSPDGRQQLEAIQLRILAAKAKLAKSNKPRVERKIIVAQLKAFNSKQKLQLQDFAQAFWQKDRAILATKPGTFKPASRAYESDTIFASIAKIGAVAAIGYNLKPVAYPILWAEAKKDTTASAIVKDGLSVIPN